MSLSVGARKAAYAASAVLVAALIVAMHIRGVPVFLQDWIWPTTRFQASELFSTAGRLWQEGNGGFPAASPNGVVVAWLLFGGAALLGPLTALNTELALLVVIGFSTTFYYLRLRGAFWWGAGLGAGLYACSPIFYNKLEAGHYYYLVAYAFMPAGFALMARARCATRPFHAAALTVCAGCAFALATAQFQFVGILLLGIAAELVAWRKLDRAASIAAGAAACMIGLHVADYSIMLAPQSLAQYAPQATPKAWLASQSQPLFDAVGSVAYIGGYAGRALSSLASVFQIAVILAVIFGLWASMKDRIGDAARSIFAGVVLFAAGALIVSGTLGPLSVFIQYAFAHDVRFSAFRELYDFAVLTQFGIALIVGSAVARTRSGIATAATAVFLLALSFSIYVIASPGKTIPTAPPETLARAFQLDRNRDAGRVAFLPTSPSVSLRGSSASGIDSYGQYWGTRPALVDTIADTRFAYVLEKGVDSPGLWSRLNVDYVVYREEAVSNYPNFLDPYSRKIAEAVMSKPRELHGFRGAVLPPPRSVRLSNDVTTGSPLWDVVKGIPATSHLVSVPLAAFNLYEKHAVTVDPLHGWAQSLRWYGAIPALGCLPSATIFRITSVERLRNRTPDCAWRLAKVNAALLCYRLNSPGLAAEGPCISEDRYRALEKQLDMQARNAVGKSAVLAYIGEAYDGRWRLQCGDARAIPEPLPVLVDANSMGWIVPSNACGGKFIVFFEPDRWFQSLVITLWCGVIAAAIVLFALDSRMKSV